MSLKAKEFCKRAIKKSLIRLIDGIYQNYIVEKQLGIFNNNPIIGKHEEVHRTISKKWILNRIKNELQLNWFKYKDIQSLIFTNANTLLTNEFEFFREIAKYIIEIKDEKTTK